jgi:YggT family protein
VITLLYWLLSIYLVVLAARAILSWFPIRPGSPLTPIRSLLTDLTEPVLRPVRSVIPPIGMFDLSFMIVFFVLFLVWQALNNAR